MAKKYTIEFTRNAVYQETGYVLIDASSKAEAREIAKEMLENGGDVMDYEGDVSDLDFVPEQLLESPQVKIHSIEVDDIISGDDEPDEEYDECEDEEDF